MKSPVMYEDPEQMENEDVDNVDGIDKEELEIALYSQIHFETNDSIEIEVLDSNEILDNFTIDVKGNYKTGFQLEPKTSDYITDEQINSKFKNTPRERNAALSDIDVKNSVSDKSKAMHLRNKYMYREFISDKKSNLNALDKIKTKTKSRSDKSLAEKLILGSGSSSKIDTLDDTTDETSDESIDTDSDEELIDLDIEDSDEEDSGLYVNVKKDQQSLLAKEDGKEWNIDIDDKRQSNSTVRPRYYKPIGVFCKNCDQLGHLSKNCPKPKKEKVCIYCSDTGHMFRNCPDAFCYNCEEPGHTSKDCPHSKRSLFRLCVRCNMQGHRQRKCPDLWRQYHRTIQGNKLIRGKKRKLHKKTCYNCASDDHLGHECDDDRMDRYSRPTYPFICQYMPLEFDLCSRDETEYPVSKRSKEDSESFSEKKRVSEYVINKETVSGSTGRNNFDRLQFSSSKKSLLSTNKVSEKPFGKSKKKKLKAVETAVEIPKKRNIDADIKKSPKRQKVMDKAEKVVHKATNSKTGKLETRAKGDKYEKLNNVNERNIQERPSNKKLSDVVCKTNRSPKHSVNEEEAFYKQGTNSKPDTYKDEVNITFVNKSRKHSVKEEENISRQHSSKPDSYSNEIRISFVNDLAHEVSKSQKHPINEEDQEHNVSKSRKHYINEEEDFPRRAPNPKPDLRSNEIKITFTNNLHTSSHNLRDGKKFKPSDFTEEVDHQVFRNEWWFDEGGKSRRKNKKKKQKKK